MTEATIVRIVLYTSCAIAITAGVLNVYLSMRTRRLLRFLSTEAARLKRLRAMLEAESEVWQALTRAAATGRRAPDGSRFATTPEFERHLRN